MENPFRKRATEFLRDDEAFLAVVTPEPIRYFLAEPGRDGRLYDRLVLLHGTPGSGKTTLARLFEFPTIHTLVQNQNFEGHKDISSALTLCGAIKRGLPRVLGYRVPMENGYRDFWEVNYSDDLKTNLMVALLQARAVLGWCRHLNAAGIPNADILVVARPEAVELVDTIGGVDGDGLRNQAVAVEAAIYDAMNSLVAPSPSALPHDAVRPYRPFDIIERFSVPYPSGPSGNRIEVQPLAIFDDAHVLHPKQYRLFAKFLVRRELRIARWMIARFDILGSGEALETATIRASGPGRFAGISADRDAEVVFLQSSTDRLAYRTRFRTMAKDMASRYLRRMPLLSERGLANLGDLLGDTTAFLRASALETLRRKVQTAQNRLHIGLADRDRLESTIARYPKAQTEDVRLAMLYIMMHRLEGRRRRKAAGLFDDPRATASPDLEVAANDGVHGAALFQLQDYGRPYYYGIDRLCDASSENAEQFLQLAAELVEAVVTQLARGKPVVLSPARQHALLRARGERIMDGWRFPHDARVTALVTKLAERCRAKSLEPNGAVIANAIGIPQDDFARGARDLSDLAAVLQFAISYNAISLVPRYPCKNRLWCLLELGGMVLLRFGLTTRRGGFIETTSADLAKLLTEESS